MIELSIVVVYFVGVFLCYVLLEYLQPKVEDSGLIGLFWFLLIPLALGFYLFNGIYRLAQFVAVELREWKNDRG